jgi:hypothetical protein
MSLAVLKQTQSVTDQMIADGMYSFGEALDANAARSLLTKVLATRTIDQTLFLSEAEFDANPEYKGTNPRPGRNLVEKFEGDFDFIEKAPAIVSALTEILGDGYRIFDKKFVCGVPETQLPGWLLKRIGGNAVNNLGSFMKPEYRDITYFYGIDFHQDLIDHSGRPADFLTLYIYLDTVTKADAPLYVLPGSHQFGGTSFPHDLSQHGAGMWRYGDGRGNSALLRQHVLTGGAGYAAFWHACTLHGTQPDVADHPRISVRYKIERAGNGPCGLDLINAALNGPLELPATRVDVDDKGRPVMKTNHVVAAKN